MVSEDTKDSQSAQTAPFGRVHVDRSHAIVCVQTLMNHCISSPEVLYCHQTPENLPEYQPHALYLLSMGLHLLTEFLSICLTFPRYFSPVSYIYTGSLRGLLVSAQRLCN